MIRRPPRSTRTDTSFPTRRSSDLGLDLFAVRQPRFHRSRRLFRSGRQPDRDARWCDAGDRAWLQAVAGAVPSVAAGRLRGCAGTARQLPADGFEGSALRGADALLLRGRTLLPDHVLGRALSWERMYP